MDMVETTKQFPPPVNILNNSERNLRLAFYPCTSHLKYVCIYVFSIIVSKLCSSFLKSSTYFPKSLNENRIVIWESFCMLHVLKFMLNRGISATLGTITFLCDTFMILLPITLIRWEFRRHFLFPMNNFLDELLAYRSGSFPLMTSLCQSEIMCRKEPNPASFQLCSQPPKQHFP